MSSLPPHIEAENMSLLSENTSLREQLLNSRLKAENKALKWAIEKEKRYKAVVAARTEGSTSEILRYRILEARRQGDEESERILFLQLAVVLYDLKAGAPEPDVFNPEKFNNLFDIRHIYG